MSRKNRLMDLGYRRSRLLNLPVIVGGLLLCLMGAMVLHGWSQRNSFVPAIQVLLGTAEGGAAGEVISQGDITLYIPPNATGQQGTFLISEANLDVALVSNDTEWIRPKVVNLEFRQPNGVPLSDITFDEPLEICFSLGDEQWQAFLTQPDAFEVQHYLEDADPPYWEVLPQASYAERQQLCGQVDELSAFALAIKVEAQVPVTGSTATSVLSALVPTRTLIPPTQQRRRDGASSVSSLGGGSAAPTSTSTPRPTNTLRPANTATPEPTDTNTPRPTRRPLTPTPTRTSAPTQVPSQTPPPTATQEPTEPPPTVTPTDPPPPPTATQEPTEPPPPPTATQELPTPEPEPSDTPIPEPDPTETEAPAETPSEDPGEGL